ncbi:MAG: LytR/AlgR family response regulator transcription factor, partial [Blastocatellia bacterium]
FAVRAFGVHALDYLLKPFDQTRFKNVLDRARGFIGRQRDSGLTEKVQKLLQEVKREKPAYISRLLINERDRAFFLEADRIDWIESSRNYLTLHVGKDTHSVRGTIEGLCARLDPEQFVRINRSQAINLSYVRELQPWFHGEFKVILKDGTEMSWSRRYMDRSSDLFVNRF